MPEKINKNTVRSSPDISAAGEQRIPRGYDIDTIVIMPVNADTSFIYWEITDRLLGNHRMKLKKGAGQLMIRVMDSDCRQEVCLFEVKEMIGKNYINYQPSMKPLIAEIGIMNGSGFKGLLRSGNAPASSLASPVNTISRSAGQGKKPSRSSCEIWMTRAGHRRETVTLPNSSGSAEHIRLIEYYLNTAGEPEKVSSAEFTDF